MTTFHKYLDIIPEIKEALAENRPVVALESTILSHGMPYPSNLAFAKRVDDIIRAEGAVPATIAIMNGRLKIGLTNEELETMCVGKEVEKVSRRDMPMILTTKKNGATTVATTMYIASLVGIRVFATGGIGGVHRGASVTFDISADLQELSHTSVAVVCAGAKSILDIGLTLEYLETMGVPVLGYQTDKFPAFYSRESGFGVDFEAKDAAQVAEILKNKWDVGLEGGVVVSNPVPEEHALNYLEMERVTHAALEAANKAAVHGKNATPFMLSYIEKHTSGVSLATNEQLAYNNAKVAAQIAKEYANLTK